MQFGPIALIALVATAATARAQTPCYAENSGASFDDSMSMSSDLLAVRFTAPANFGASSVEVFTGEVTGSMTVWLYADDPNANQPGLFLEYGSWNASSTNSWQGATLGFPTFLAGGQKYWLVWTPVAGAQASNDSLAPGLGQTYRTSANNGQSWSGPFQDAQHHWKFRIFGTCGSGVPSVYCTAGTTTHGCAPAISFSGAPSASSGSGFTITVSGVEGLAAGIVFYGIDNTGYAPAPWGASSSFLCVKHPTQRTGAQNSGGTFTVCDGVLALDWNAYVATHPSALGSPFAIGQHVFAQGWFRDPPSPKSTMLSDALEFVVAP
jgi:hypothetical protein